MSTITAIATRLLRILTDNFIKNSMDTPSKKALWMFGAGLLFIRLAHLWDLDFPINKNLWTSSFVLNVGGYSLILLSVFYYVIDVLGYKRWTFFFRVIGMNSILIYMSGRFINWEYTSNAFFGWLGQLLSNPWNDVILA